MNFIDILNTATTHISDYALAKKLSISTATVSAWRCRGSIPNDELLEKIAEIAKLPLETVYCAAYADKIENPVVSDFLRSKAVADAV